MSSITDWLDYTPRGTGVRTRGYRVQVSPNSGSTASPGDTVRFDIPAGRGRSSFLDPSQTTLQFIVKITGDGSNIPSVDGSYYAFLNRFTLLSSGQVLEDVADYNHAVSTFLDLQVQGVDMGGAGSAIIGTASEVTNNVNKLGAAFATGTAYGEACLPLHLSGILGTACPKLLPAGMLQDLRAEFVIEPAVTAVVQSAGSAPTILLQSVVMNLFYVDVDPAVADQLYAQNGGVYRISTECWRSYQYTPGSATTADSVMIPARFSSVKSFFTTWRPYTKTLARAWLSNRVNPFYSSTAVKGSAQYAVGSLLFPNTPLQSGISEMFASMLQSFHSQANANMNTRCTQANWINNVISVDAQAMGTFALGVNTENLCYKSKSFTTGTNTLTSPVVLNATYPAALATAPVITTIVHFDAICEISETGVAMRF